MKQEVEILLPKLGESIVRATIVRWFKKEGDTILLDEPLLEVATDKVNSEIPSPVSGIVKKIFFSKDDEVDVGTKIAIIEAKDFVENKKEEKIIKEEIIKENLGDKSFLSPIAKRLIKKNNIPIDEIKNIKTTGTGGRLSKQDVEKYLSSKKDVKCGDRLIKMSQVRKSISKKMLEAVNNIPSASVVIEVDITSLFTFIKKNKEKFLEKEGVKLSITSFLAKEISSVAKEFYYMNAEVIEDSILIKKDVNIGIAIDTENGLLVPNIKNCDTKSINAIAKDISILAKKAKSNSLSLLDIEKGTITMTNFGMGGALFGIPIIKYPEVAIIGIGSIVDRAVFDKDNLTKKKILTISCSFDHRVVDGMYACKFMKKIKENLEQNYETSIL